MIQRKSDRNTTLSTNYFQGNLRYSIYGGSPQDSLEPLGINLLRDFISSPMTSLATTAQHLPPPQIHHRTACHYAIIQLLKCFAQQSLGIPEPFRPQDSCSSIGTQSLFLLHSYKEWSCLTSLLSFYSGLPWRMQDIFYCLLFCLFGFDFLDWFLCLKSLAVLELTL